MQLTLIYVRLFFVVIVIIVVSTIIVIIIYLLLKVMIMGLISHLFLLVIMNIIRKNKGLFLFLNINFCFSPLLFSSWYIIASTAAVTATAVIIFYFCWQLKTNCKYKKKIKWLNIEKIYIQYKYIYKFNKK